MGKYICVITEKPGDPEINTLQHEHRVGDEEEAAIKEHNYSREHWEGK